MFNIVKIFSSKPVKIARESLNIEDEPNRQQEGQDWRKFVGSIRRKVQRHASASDQASAQSKAESVSRKKSFTKAETFKKEKSEEKDTHKSVIQPLAKQKSDYFKALSFRDESNSESKTSERGVRKSDKKDIRHSLIFSRKSNPKNKEGIKQDDFLKATMRIFLVVSPPVGKLQVCFFASL